MPSAHPVPTFPPPAVLVVLWAAWARGRQRALRKGLLQSSRDDMRDNILNYDEQGGGEEDQVSRTQWWSWVGGVHPSPTPLTPLLPPQDAYDINQLRHPELFLSRIKPPVRRDAPLSSATPLAPRKLPSSRSDIKDFINEVGMGSSTLLASRLLIPDGADHDPPVPTGARGG